MLNASKYDKWKTTTPEDRAHSWDCSCPGCHARHLEDIGTVVSNALDFPQDFKCCAEQLEEWAGKLVCIKHPRAYFDSLSGCEICQCDSIRRVV